MPLRGIIEEFKSSVFQKEKTPSGDEFPFVKNPMYACLESSENATNFANM